MKYKVLSFVQHSLRIIFKPQLGKAKNFRLIGGELSGEFGARYLAEERIFDSLMSIVSALYILHKPVVHVCSEEFLINLRHK